MTIEQINALNQHHLPEFRLFALSFTRDEDRAQDLLQDVSYQVFKNRDSFQAGTNFPAWVKRIIHNVFISGYRTKKRRDRIISQNGLPAGWGGDFSVTNTVVNTLEEEDVKGLIDQLPRIYREVFLLHLRGMRYQDIAMRTGVPVGTIKSRLFKARFLLKQKLPHHGVSGKFRFRNLVGAESRVQG